MNKRNYMPAAASRRPDAVGFRPVGAETPSPKSQKELDALQAWQAATDPDERIKAIENVLTNFADTEFKIYLLQDALQQEQRKGDFAQSGFLRRAVARSRSQERVRDGYSRWRNSSSYPRVRSRQRGETRQGGQVRQSRFGASKDMPKPRPDITDAQWEGAKKDLQAQAYEAMGQSAALRKKYDDAIADFKQAIAVQATPDPATWVRLGQAYEDAGKLDDATDAFDKAINTPNVNPQSEIGGRS